jgi:hypothetical protein
MAGIADDIAQLAALRDQGVITQDEFEQQKARLLNGGEKAQTTEPPIPARKKSKAGKGCLIVVGILFLLIIIGAIAGGGGKNNTVAAPGAGGSETTAAAADAKPEPSLSMAGYNQIRNGMTFEQVTAIIGNPSQEMSRSELAGTETVMYLWEGSLGANMNAMFQDGKLIQKAQFGLR